MKKTYITGAYQRDISSFGGLDLRGTTGEGSHHRFARLENLWRDYLGGDGEALETFPGFRVLWQMDHTIFGIWKFSCERGDYLAIHSGRSLYLTKPDGSTPPVCPPGAENVLQENTSTAFTWGERLYLLDGANYYLLAFIDGGFTFTSVKDTYIPVTFSDGVAYEARNLLSTSTTHRFHLLEKTPLTYVQDNLQFNILDRSAMTCEVSGMPRNLSSYPTVLYIPSQVTLGGVTYQVIRVGWKAFSQINTIEEVYIGEGVTTICTAAFDCCRGLKIVHLPDSLVEIERIAFQKCPLERLYIGSSLTTVQGDNFTEVDKGLTIQLHGYEVAMKDQLNVDSDGNDAYFAATKSYVEHPYTQILYFPLCEAVTGVEQVTLDGTPLSYEEANIHITPITKSGLVIGILFRGDNHPYLWGKVLEVLCRVQEGVSQQLLGAKGACLFDGRMFLWGCKDAPHRVYYTSLDRDGDMNPAYIGAYHYFDVGAAHTPISALLPTASYLAVLKEEAEDEGAVHFYQGKNTSQDLIPRIYERVAFVGAKGCGGGAINFLDDPIYLSPYGVEALGYQSLSMERSVYHRSTLIDTALAKYKGQPCFLGEWQGYLTLLFSDGDMYLGDSRRIHTLTGQREYEWYHLTGIGTHTGELPVFRYASAYVEDTPPTLTYGGEEVTLTLHKMGDELPLGATYDTYPACYHQILSGIDSQGNIQYFTREADEGITTYYLLAKTRELTGGTFSPPTALFTTPTHLYFGCENGAVCLVNTDETGVAMGRDRYTYAGHAIPCGLITIPDDCGVANYTKKTLRGTSVVEVKGDFSNTLSLQVKTHHGGYTSETPSISFWDGGLDFSTLSFDRLAFTPGENQVIATEERTKRWISKQYLVWSHGFCQPFGIRRLGYSYRVEGKVKNR